ncbi:cytochrome P450 [Hypoxylon sp. FL1284]|nr:cytochrome P450 [Hypoxylon sp. FL1284]
MGLPLRLFTAVSLISSYLSYHLQPEWTALRLTGIFFATYLLQSLSYGLWRVVLYPKFLSPLRGLPGPAGGSFFNGHFKEIRQKPTGIPMRDWVATIPNDGMIRYLTLFNQERLFITGSKALAEVLVTRNYDFKKPGNVRFGLSRLLGVGVLLAEGEEHKFQRKNLMPAFAFRHVKDLYSQFWEKGREVVEAMSDMIIAEAQKTTSTQDPEKASKTTVIEVGTWASRATLDIIGQSGLGKDFGAIKNPDGELNRTYRRVFKASKEAQVLALLALFIPQWVINHLPVKRNNDINEAAQTIRNVCLNLIREKKEKLARKELTDRDILSVALESGAFTDENLVDQLMTFLAAGHETTATSMTWAIYMLCRYPEVQKKLRAEVRERLPAMASDREVTSLDIDRMPYLNAVCNEVLRYYAPVPMTMREAAVDTTILGQRVPKGTTVMMCPWATNLDKTLWGPDADVFDPERWIAKGPDDKRAASGGANSNYAFLTFLHGPRSCIGLAFARAEFACLLAAWVGRFEFRLKNAAELDERNIEIKGGVTARPSKGMHVYATVLDGW